MRTIAAILISLSCAVAVSAKDNVPLRNWKRAVVPHTDISDRAAFIAVEPCRLVDTRDANGPYGGPAFSATEIRTYDIPAGLCADIPIASAYSLSFAVVGYSGPGWITAFPATTTLPGVSTVNYGTSGPAVANAAIVPATSGSISVYSHKVTHVIVDINGYFIEPASAITSIDAGDGLTATGTTTVTVDVDFAGTGSANTVARSDHSHFVKTIIVNPVGTDLQNGAALAAAISGITDSSAVNPYLVKIAPGTYEVTSSMTPPEYVHLEGSGRGTTTIVRNDGNLFVIHNAGTEIRDLTLTGSGDIEIVDANTAGISLLDVEITGDPAGETITGFIARSGSGTSRLTRVTIDLDTGDSRGVVIDAGTIVYLRDTHVTVDGTLGMAVNGEADVRRSSFTVAGEASAGIELGNPDGPFNASEVVVKMTSSESNAAGVRVSGTEDVSLRRMDIQATGTGVRGIDNESPNLAVFDTKITASGTGSIGVANSGGGEATLSGVVVEAAGTALSNGTSTAAAINVHRGRLKGATAINSSANYTLNVGNAQVDGTVTVAGTIVCANAFNGSFNALNATCQ